MSERMVCCSFWNVIGVIHDIRLYATDGVE